MVEMPMYFYSLGANRTGAEADFLHEGQEAEARRKRSPPGQSVVACLAMPVVVGFGRSHKSM